VKKAEKVWATGKVAKGALSQEQKAKLIHSLQVRENKRSWCHGEQAVR
jgi:hypothetical protein